MYTVIILYRQLGLPLLEWRFYYFHMFRNPVNQFMHLNPLPAVKTFTWTGAERHAWWSRYWRSRGQIDYRRNRRNGARLLQRTHSYNSKFEAMFFSQHFLLNSAWHIQVDHEEIMNSIYLQSLVWWLPNWLSCKTW